MNILITSAGQRVSLVKAFKKELEKLHDDSKVFTIDLMPQLSAACHVSDRAFTSKKFEDPEYISDLLEICKMNQIKMVIPTIDTELLLLSKNRDLFLDNGIDVIISDVQFVSVCRDKRKTNQYFNTHFIKTPKIINKLEPYFPLFIKPFNGSSSKDTYSIYHKAQLTDYLLENDNLMFMEYISKDLYDEYTVDIYYGKDSKIKCIVPRLRLRVRAGEVNKALTCRNEIIPFLKEKFAVIDGARGCITMQLFMNKREKNILGIEINPRFGGGFPLSYLAGANYPQWLIQEYFFNEEIPFQDNWESGLLMLRYDGEIIVHGFEN